MNNIIVLDSYFNLTNKSNLNVTHKYDLIRFFEYLVVASFFGATLSAKVKVKYWCFWLLQPR